VRVADASAECVEAGQATLFVDVFKQGGRRALWRGSAQVGDLLP
jgi:hypothetical protein